MTVPPRLTSTSPFSGVTSVRACPVCSSSEVSPAFDRVDGARFVSCRTCKLTFASPAPSAEALQDFYATYYSNYRVLRAPPVKALRAAARAKAYDPLTAFAVQHLGRAPDSAADIGCGQGARLAFLRELGVGRLAGCELDAIGAKLARETYGLDVRRGDASTLKDLRFQLVFLSEVVEHVLDPLLLLRQCAQLLEPGGILVISTPNSAARFRAGRRWKGFFADFDHITLFSDSSLTTALAACQFDVIETLAYGLPAPSSERMGGACSSQDTARLAGRARRAFSRIVSSITVTPQSLEEEWGHTLLCAARLASTDKRGDSQSDF